MATMQTCEVEATVTPHNKARGGEIVRSLFWGSLNVICVQEDDSGIRL
jgi:hypothetical protein